MDFLGSTLGFWVSLYLAVGCLVVQITDKGRVTPIISWILGVVLWLPILVIGTALGIYETFRRK